MASINNASANAQYNKLPENWNSNIPANTTGKKNNAAIWDLQSLIAAGINPKTGMPLKIGSGVDSYRKETMKKLLRIKDEQQAVNRYKWYNLPCNITSQELERLLYYKGQLAFFYMKDSDEFWFMPYALNGGIDFYGRFRHIHPIPVAEGISDEEKKRLAEQRNYLSTLKLKCEYDVLLEEEVNDDVKSDSCVLLHDYTKQLSQTILPRQQLHDGFLDIQSDIIPFMRTALLNSTGIQGLRVGSEDEQSNVTAASASVDRAALNGEKYIAVVGNMEFQDLSGGETLKAEEFAMSYQTLDNIRLSMYGLENGGAFQKKAHMLQDEQNMNASNEMLVYTDGLAIRQHFCDIVNSIWDLDIWCDVGDVSSTMDPMGMDDDYELDDGNSEGDFNETSD